MRISDWSSDVCSSDLITLGDRTLAIVLQRHPRARRLTLRLAPDASEVRITMPAWARSAEAIAFAHARRDWLGAQLTRIPQRRSTGPGDEIGRASCRERVCTYV